MEKGIWIILSVSLCSSDNNKRFHFIQMIFADDRRFLQSLNHSYSVWYYIVFSVHIIYTWPCGRIKLHPLPHHSGSVSHLHTKTQQKQKQKSTVARVRARARAPTPSILPPTYTKHGSPSSIECHHLADMDGQSCEKIAFDEELLNLIRTDLLSF